MKVSFGFFARIRIFAIDEIVFKSFEWLEFKLNDLRLQSAFKVIIICGKLNVSP